MVAHQGRQMGQVQSFQQGGPGSFVVGLAFGDIVHQTTGAGQFRVQGGGLGRTRRTGDSGLVRVCSHARSPAQSLGQGAGHGAHRAGVAQAFFRHGAQTQQLQGFGRAQGRAPQGQPLQAGIVFGAVHVFQHGGIGYRQAAAGQGSQCAAQAIGTGVGGQRGQGCGGDAGGMAFLSGKDGQKYRVRGLGGSLQQGAQGEGAHQGHVYGIDQDRALTVSGEQGLQARLYRGEHAPFRRWIARHGKAQGLGGGLHHMGVPTRDHGDVRNAGPAKGADQQGQSALRFNFFALCRAGQGQEGLDQAHAAGLAGGQNQGARGPFGSFHDNLPCSLWSR